MLTDHCKVPPFSPQPFGWPYRLEGEDCALYVQHGMLNLTTIFLS